MNTKNQLINAIRTNKTERIVIYLFCILNSISGLEIAGVSINTIIVSVFAIFIVYEYLSNKNGEIGINKKNYFWKYILSAFLSCMFSSMYSYTLSQHSTAVSYLINCIMFSIIYLFIANCKKTIKSELVLAFRDGLIYTARIQVVWGLLQLTLLYSAGININEILFRNILHSTNTREWIMGFYRGDTWSMRITGLNFENSMFALVACIGMALEKKIIWKLILITTAILCLSRTGWIMTLGYLAILLIRWLKSNKKKISLTMTAVIGGMVAFGITLFMINGVFQRQVNNVIYRLNDADAINISATKHLMYYPFGVKLWLENANILQKLLGYGMRCSGVPFSQNPKIASALGIIYKSENTWAVECDVIGLLLGGGIITCILYYMMCTKIIRNHENIFRDAIWIIFLGGISYHYHTISYVVFVFMFASLYREDFRIIYELEMEGDVYEKSMVDAI